MAGKKYVTLEDGMGERYRIPEDKVQQAMETFAEQREAARKLNLPEDRIRLFDLQIVKDEE